MPSPVPAVDRAPWVELDLEISPEDEERVAASLWAGGSVGAWTIREGLVRAYFEGRAEDVEARFRAAWLEVTGEEWPGALCPRIALERDWLARWRASVGPVEVTATLWVVPPGAVAGDRVPRGRRVVVIQPGQGFGTGSHPTTRALLAWLESEPGERVLDVGCGSGVLGIAALLLGARFAVGLDPDPDALANADENRGHNGLRRELRLVRGSVDALAPDARFDRVLANLDRRTLGALTGALVERCAPGGRIGVAGLLAAEAAGFRETLAGHPVEIAEERTDGDPATGDAWWSAWLAREAR